MKSKARIKFFGLLLLFWILGSIIEYFQDNSSHNMLGLVLIFIISILSLSIFLVRCEICGVYIYRFNKKNHGIPSLKSLIPVSKCPVCKTERF